MKHIPISNTVKTPAERFTGDVYLTMIKTPEPPSKLIASLVRFTPGARTFWHTHDRGQTLHVTEGVGLVASRDGSVSRIRLGDTVTIEAGEEHWHGGTATTCMSHLALVSSDGESDPTTWQEAVTDQEYAAAQ